MICWKCKHRCQQMILLKETIKFMHYLYLISKQTLRETYSSVTSQINIEMTLMEDGSKSHRKKVIINRLQIMSTPADQELVNNKSSGLYFYY